MTLKVTIGATWAVASLYWEPLEAYRLKLLGIVVGGLKSVTMAKKTFTPIMLYV